MDVRLNEEGQLLISAYSSNDKYALSMFQKENPEIVSLSCIQFDTKTEEKPSHDPLGFFRGGAKFE